jgi:uncharacterized membrane protein
VGYSYTAHDAATHAFVSNPSEGNTLTDLGTLGGANSQAFAINSFGVAVGTSQTTATDQYGNQISDVAVWYTPKGKIYDLGNLGGNFAQANAVSDCLTGTGWAKLKGAYLGDPTAPAHAFVTSGTKLKDIGTLGGTYAQGNAVNNARVVVGYSNKTGDAGIGAFVWTASKGMVDLNSFLPPGSPWTLQVASGINDSGEIVGYGTLNGEFHAFQWKLPQYAANRESCEGSEEDE